MLVNRQEWETAQVALCGVMSCSSLIQFDWCLRWIPVGKQHDMYPHQVAICGRHGEFEVRELIAQHTPVSKVQRTKDFMYKIAKL